MGLEANVFGRKKECNLFLISIICFVNKRNRYYECEKYTFVRDRSWQRGYKDCSSRRTMNYGWEILQGSKEN